MMRPLSLFLVAGLLIAGGQNGSSDERNPGAASASCTRLAQEAAADLLAEYREFDQAAGRGWRGLRAAGCNREAVHLIRAYLGANEKLPQNQRANLNFHAAQIALDDGDIATAVGHLDQSRIGKDTSKWPLDWNSYVAATRAFATRDRPAFEENYRRLVSRRVADPGCEGAEQCLRRDGNADAVERLHRCWDQPYAVAYHECRPTSEGPTPPSRR